VQVVGQLLLGRLPDVFAPAVEGVLSVDPVLAPVRAVDLRAQTHTVIQSDAHTKKYRFRSAEKEGVCGLPLLLLPAKKLYVLRGLARALLSRICIK
jgi:hypothetical protein